jgi:transcriptional regulator with XRE-family HTH domain
MHPPDVLPAMRFLRKPKRMTQTELGNMIGKSQNFIYRVEHGLRKLEPEEWEKILLALQTKK